MIDPNKTKCVFWLLVVLVLAVVAVGGYFVYCNHFACKCNNVDLAKKAEEAAQEVAEDLENQ